LISQVLHVSREFFRRHDWIRYTDDGLRLAAICIGDPDTEKENTEQFKFAIHIQFWDTEPNTKAAEWYPPAIPEQLDDIADFIKILADDDRPFYLVVHCEVGISRSAGVACAVADTYDLLIDRARAAFANQYIYKELLRRLQ